MRGDPTAAPTVYAAVANPAAAHDRPSVFATCRVRVMPIAVAGIRAKTPTSSSARMPGRART
jgi:hypothetical protein